MRQYIFPYIINDFSEVEMIADERIGEHAESLRRLINHYEEGTDVIIELKESIRSVDYNFEISPLFQEQIKKYL